MKISIRKSFVKDSLKLSTQDKIDLGELVESIAILKSPSSIPHVKKMRGFKNAYRIRFGLHRIGFFRTKDGIELVRVLRRRDIYKYFP